MNPKVGKIVFASRRALETEVVRNSLINLRNFPTGCCADASLLVGQVLLDNEIDDIRIIYGEDSENKTHAWLESKEFLIDITADQFPNIGRYILKNVNGPILRHLGYDRIRSDIISLKYTAVAWRAFSEEFGKFYKHIK